MNNPPDDVLKNFEKLKKTQKEKPTDWVEVKKWRSNTWKHRYVKHEFKHAFSEPIPKEDGDIFYLMSENEADELNREFAKTRSLYVFRKYTNYVDEQKKILKSKYGNDYPLITEALKRDRRIEFEKAIKPLIKEAKKIKKRKKGKS